MSLFVFVCLCLSLFVFVCLCLFLFVWACLFVFLFFSLTLGRSFKLADDQVAASWADRDGYQTASGSATLNLRAGDKVNDSFCDDDEGDNDDYGKYFD